MAPTSPLCVPWDGGAAAQEARRSEVPQWGTEATACADAAEPLTSMTRLAPPVRSPCGGASPAPASAQEHRPPRSPAPFSPTSSPSRGSGSPSVHLSLLSRTIWKSTKGPLPRIGLFCLLPARMAGWEAGRHLDSSLCGRCTRCPRNAHHLQRQDFAKGAFLFLFPWKK